MLLFLLFVGFGVEVDDVVIIERNINKFKVEIIKRKWNIKIVLEFFKVIFVEGWKVMLKNDVWIKVWWVLDEYRCLSY